MNSIRLILSLGSRFGWSIHQMDVKSAFLHGDLAEEIYMDPPLGFMTNPTIVSNLKKSLYVLKWAPRAWYEKIYHFCQYWIQIL